MYEKCIILVQFSLESSSVPELNSTSPSTGELGEFVEDVENDELNKDRDDDEDAVEDILYMRGASFTIHLDPPAENSTTNSTKINEETNVPLDRVEPRATSQVCDQKFNSNFETFSNLPEHRNFCDN